MMSQEVTHKDLSMSINGVDYTKQLAKDREHFQDANKKLRDATERRVEDTNKRADYVMDKQRDNFIEDKADLETAYQKNIDNLKVNTAITLDSNGDKFHKNLEKERENFSQDSLKKSKDFDQRLNDIKSSYAKTSVAEKNRNEDINNVMDKKYSRNVDELRKNSDGKIQEYQDRLSGAGASLKDQYNRERQQLVRTQEERLAENFRDSAQKRSNLKDQISTENKKIKLVQEAEAKSQKQYFNDRNTSMQKKFQNRYETMSKDYSLRSDNFVDAQKRSNIKTNKEHQEKVVELKRGFNDQFRLIEIDKRRRDNGSGEFSEAVAKQKGMQDQVIHDNKVRNLKDQMVEIKRDYQDRAGSDQKAFNDQLAEQSSVATANLDRKLNEANANKIVTVSREREKAEFEVQNREHQNRLSTAGYEQKLMLEKANSNVRLDKLKENFNTSINALEERNLAGMEDVTKISNKDKAEFIKKMQEARVNENFEMKREFGKVMDATVQDYEQRLATYQRDNEYIKTNLNQKIQNVIDQTEKQLDSQRTLFEDRRSADIKSQQLLMDERENSLKKNLNQMNLTYQKKIDKMQIESESKLKLITNGYETKLNELKATTSKELAMKDTTHRAELDLLKQAFEEEKNRVVSAYQGQIDAIKRGHKDQMDQMADFKRLS
jgi:hypothetical protein